MIKAATNEMACLLSHGALSLGTMTQSQGPASSSDQDCPQEQLFQIGWPLKSGVLVQADRL
jgi:hypothetical protein